MSKTGTARLPRIVKDARSATSDLEDTYPRIYTAKGLADLARRYVGVAFHLEQLSQELALEEAKEAAKHKTSNVSH